MPRLTLGRFAGRAQLGAWRRTGASIRLPGFSTTLPAFAVHSLPILCLQCPELLLDFKPFGVNCASRQLRQDGGYVYFQLNGITNPGH